MIDVEVVVDRCGAGASNFSAVCGVNFLVKGGCLPNEISFETITVDGKR